MTPIELRNTQIKRERQLTVLLILYGLAALILSGLGIYGLLTYMVAQRKPEIAVRIALGATRREVLQMVMRESFVPALMGICAGLVIALGLIHSITGIRDYLAAALFEVSANDPWILAAAVLLLFMTAAVATIVSAWGAWRINPMSALRHN